MRKIIFLTVLALYAFGVEPTEQMVRAIKDGNLSALKSIVSTKEEANAALPNGKNILMLAVWEGKVEIVKYLLEKGAEINSADSDKKTPLMLAVWRENLELVKFLIEKGADKATKNREGMGLAEIAELTGNGDIVDYVQTLK